MALFVYVWIPRTLIWQLSENILHFRQQMRLWQTWQEPNTSPNWMLHLGIGKLNCSKLLTFQTPFGRFKFNRLAFGVKSASEMFQRKVGEIIEGLQCCKNNQDDIIIWGRSKVEHGKRLKAVLGRNEAPDLKLNREKCVFGVQQLRFLGHTCTFKENGIKPDEFKVKAILEIPQPQSKQDLRRFMGMVTYLGKFYLIYRPSLHH